MRHGHNIPLLWTHLIPATLEGRALHNVQNAMFAAALAFHMKIDLENIRQGLRTFDSTFFQSPGRLNVYDKHPFKVILDYAHNPAAVKMVCDVVDRYDIGGRKIVVLTMPGDRRDEDIMEVASIAAGHFDHYICRRDDNLRGREAGRGTASCCAGRCSMPACPTSRFRWSKGGGRPTSRHWRWPGAATWCSSWRTTSRDPGSRSSTSSPVRGRVSSSRSEQPVEIPEEFFGDFSSLDEDIELIRDERGVRIARESDD
jgi:cyanophycin synthetase